MMGSLASAYTTGAGLVGVATGLTQTVLGTGDVRAGTGVVSIITRFAHAASANAFFVGVSTCLA